MRGETEVSENEVNGKMERNFYDSVIMDEPPEEVLNVMPIQCGILNDTNDQICLTEEGCRQNVYSEWVQRNFQKLAGLSQKVL